MIDFGVIILAHLIGDYLLQNDWMATRKRSSSLACLLHVFFYTSSFVLVIESMTGWPWWAYVLIAVGHYPFDRYGLARKYMAWNDQGSFADNLGPWSVIIVDNTFHLLWAWYVWLAVGT